MSIYQLMVLKSEAHLVGKKLPEVVERPEVILGNNI